MDMTRLVFKAARGSAARLAREESGVALMLTLGAFLFLFVVCCGVYATGETIRQKVELQNAVDAAAYSAAEVQADGLSRIATLNRALSWSYIQLTKMQMDYIAYRWLRLTHKRFREDYKLAHDEHWCTGSEPLLAPFRNVVVMGVSCSRHTKEPEGWYAGSCEDGQNTEHAIRVNYSKDRELRYNRKGDFKNGDLDLYVNGSLVQRNLVGTLMNAYDKTPRLDEPNAAKWGDDLGEKIESLKLVMGGFWIMYTGVNDAMVNEMTNTARRVFMENLPRKLDGELDGALLDDFYFISFGGGSGVPDDYSGSPGSKYFQGLRNTEEDEIIFLNMADGVPGNRDNVRLRDYFNFDETEDDNGLKREANGLDQWFMRCEAAESRENNRVIVNREMAMPGTGIFRGYKNANYHEARTFGAYGLIREVHRGNSIYSEDMQNVNTGMNGRFRRWFKKLPMIGGILANFDPAQGTGGILEQYIKEMLGDLANIEPSCLNRRNRFADQCEHVNDTYGLLSEYEWGTAWWLCGWWNFLISKGNVHIPVPYYLMFHGCKPHGYGGVMDFARGTFPALLKMIMGGHSRKDYRSCFTGIGGTTMFRNHARIYGDDREIYNDNYVGIPAQPWILDERFYSGGGTIFAGGARVQRNPFERLLGEIAPKNVFSIFSPPGREPHIVAMAAARAGHAPRTGSGWAGGGDSVNLANPNPQATHELRYDSVLDKKLKPSLHDKVREDLGAAVKENLETEARLGCVCGNRAAEGGTTTTQRLRRAWNLSQPDWDGMLMPVRYAFSGLNTEYDSAVEKANPAWAVASPGGGQNDSISMLLFQLYGGAPPQVWINHNGAGKKTPEILGVPWNGNTYELFRRRRIL